MLFRKISMMNGSFTLDEHFREEDFSNTPLPKGDYESCTFSHCLFHDADLSGINFTDSSFEHCDLSTAILKKTALREVKFRHCKMLGLRFDDCNPFLLSFDFEDCALDFSSFFQVKLKGTRLVNCRLLEVDFVEADLTGAIFMGSDLSGAVFENTILEKADFRTAVNFTIDPEGNRIRGARFSMEGLLGLLGKYGILVE